MAQQARGTSAPGRPAPRARLTAIQKTLSIVLQGMLGKVIVVEMKTDAELTGLLEEVDKNMNLVMVNVRQVSPQGGVLELETAFVQGTMIRYVHIPDNVDIARDTQRHAKAMQANASMYKRSLRPAPTGTAPAGRGDVPARER
eukprot:TRINITY_DN6502_c0_g1_i2.p1 TRINITY_DN6502_c0_g1~~TRINITY_DN6502_c0_g1_i2.p1  ORF type:complete len:143 (+),score=33.87 TRINITY_DN6502_c0_g1_i2:73-501(+)